MGLLAINGFLVIILLQCGTLWANDLGTEFITAFMQNTNFTGDMNSLQLIITASSDLTSISVNITNTQIQWTNTLMQGETWSVPLPPTTEMIGSKRFQSCISVTANKDISVVSVNKKPQSVGTAALLPGSQLGTRYYVVTPTGKPKCSYKEFSVINYKFRNKVTINVACHVTFAGEIYSPKKKLTITLEPYQALQLQSEDDMSGSSVLSEQPVAVLSGHSCVWQDSLCDHVYEQLQPVSNWKKNFLVPSLVSSPDTDIAYVVAAIKNTRLVYTSGGIKRKSRLGSGEVYQITVNPVTPLSIAANFPIQVIYYYIGGTSQPQQVGSYIIRLSGSDSFCISYLAYGLPGFQNSAVIIAKTSASGGITMDSQPLPNIQWNRIPATAYSWGVFTFNTAINSHVVSHPDTAFGLLNIGDDYQSAYGSSAICSEDGSTATCQNVLCSAEETCRIVDNLAVCVKNWEYVCTAAGDPHYMTFDGSTYDFQGTCSYTMVQNCGSDGTVPVFSVQAKNENRGSSQVSYVSKVTVHVDGNTIAMVQSEYGLARVNNVRGPLPINLQGGKLQINHIGQYALLETNFGLQVLYDWKSILKVRIPGAFRGKVCGMCGNFNQNYNDDYVMPSGALAVDAIQFGSSWKTQDSDASCVDDCHGVCPFCPPELVQKYDTRDYCALLADNTNGPFRLCNLQVNPAPYLWNCVYDMCLNDGYWNMLCEAFTAYTIECQNRGIQIYEWRGSTGCSPECPPNSVYKLCGSACPETCVATSTLNPCNKMCVETCECNEGFVLSGGMCIPRSRCGCVYEGRPYAPNDKFWLDNCQGQCVCNPLSRKVECKKSQCTKEETCGLSNGIIGCYSVRNSTCVAAGDPHYSTFDGLRYDFMGTCVYLLSGLCQLYSGLVEFQVFVQNEQRSIKPVSYTKLTEMTVYGADMVISKEYPGKIKLNGLLINLPYNVGNGKILLYSIGGTAVIETDFGLKLTFDWWSYLTLTIPSTYSKAVCGLCGNLDGDPSNDLIVLGDSVTSSANDFGNSWKIRDIPGCDGQQPDNCPNLAAMVAQQRQNGNGCGILVDPNGPFSNCQNTVNPEDYFHDCVYDFCFYGGRQDIFCQMIAAYFTACQEAGATVSSWRNDNFCRPGQK